MIHRELRAGWEMNGRDVPASPLLNYAHHMKWLKGWVPRRNRDRPFTLASPLRLMTLKVSLDLVRAPRNMEMCLPGFPLSNSCSLGEYPTCRHTMACPQHKQERQSRADGGHRKILGENTHVRVLEIKTVCLSPDSLAARAGAVITVTIWGILCGTFLMKDIGKLTTHLAMTFSTCSATLPGRRVAAR